MDESKKLKKVLNFTDVLSIAYGQSIGAGVIVLTAVAIGMTGTGVVPAYFAAALITVIWSIPIAVMGSSIPATGGSYQYTARLLHPRAGFMLLLLFIPGKMTLGMYSLTFAQYLKGLWPDCPERWVAAGILTIMYIANLLGVKIAAHILKFLLAILIVSLGVFIVYGLPQINISAFSPAQMFDKGTLAWLTAAALLSFATGGANCITELGGEMKNPRKYIPGTIVIVTLSIGVLYALVGAVASGVLPISEVMGKQLSDVAKVILPHPLFVLFVVGGALLSTGKLILLTLTWGSRPILMGAVHGWFPKKLSVVNERFGTPHVVLTAMYLIGLFPIITGISLDSIAKMATGFALFVNSLPVASAFFLPKKFPNRFNNAPFAFSAGKFKIWTCVSVVILLSQGCFLLSNLPKQLFLPVAGYLCFAALVARFLPHGKVEFDEMKDDVPEKTE